MLIALSRQRRYLLFPSLLVWWLWSSMALCYAQSLPLPAEPVDHSTMAMSDHVENTVGHTEHGATDLSHDCCEDAELVPCCGPADVLQNKSSPDIDLQFFAVMLSCLIVANEPVSTTFPTVDTIANHAVFPRLHLLLSVFLD